jgi:hypothetical protein
MAQRDRRMKTSPLHLILAETAQLDNAHGTSWWQARLDHLGKEGGAPGGAQGAVQRIGFHSLLNGRSRIATKTMLTSHIAINCGWPT